MAHLAVPTSTAPATHHVLMAPEAILRRLDAEFDSSPDSIRSVVDLCSAGATPEFISLFRRDATGNLPEQRVHDLCSRFAFLTELEQRKESIATKVAEAKLDLGDVALSDCYDREFLDDIDHALRPHELTELARVAELGLSELVDAIHGHTLEQASAQEAAERFVSEEKGLPTADAVLEVIVRALAQKYGEDPLLRRTIRDELSRGILTATASDPNKSRSKNAKRYAEFFDFQEPVRRIAASRMLALRRAEREGIVRVRLDLAEGRATELFRSRFSPDVDTTSPLGQLLDLIYSHSYERYTHSGCESTVRHELKETADRETVTNFARTLRAQLMGPALGPNPAIAVRASSKAVWVASTKADGSLGPRHTLGLAEPEHLEEVAKVLAETIQEVGPKAIAIPHGRGQAGAYKHVAAALGKLESSTPKPSVIPIDETAAMVYATSANGRRRLPGTDTGMRATISLVRRLLDPLRELTRIEPRGLGLGHNLTEVHQGLLTRTLDSITAACIARVGVDLNRADTDYLARVPGLNRDQARAIVEHRNKNGAFAQIEALRDLECVDDGTFEQVAGLLRIHDGEQPLDATTLHPESYPIAAAVAELKGVEVPALLGQSHRDVDLSALCEKAGCERNRGLEVLRALASHGRDVRGSLETLDNQNVTTIADLSADKQLRGRVTNLTDFGAFVDLGIGIDGLVHISQIPGSRARDPEQMLRVGEIVEVYVVNVDENGKRISLTMHRPRHIADGRNPTIGERLAPAKRGRGRGRGAPRDAAPMNRAAREPEGRRGGRRTGPRPPRTEGAPGGGGGDSFRGGGRGRGRRDDRDGNRGGNRSPRVYTIEPERQAEETRGHKGELRSLSALGALLGGGGSKPDQEPKPAKAEKPPAPPPTQPSEPTTPPPADSGASNPPNESTD